MDEGSDVVGVSLPVDDELSLSDELADPGTDHVHADDGSVLLAHQLDEAGGLENLALAVPGEVELHRLDGVPVGLLGLVLGQADRGDLRLAVGHARDPRLDRKSTRLNSSHVAISYA